MLRETENATEMLATTPNAASRQHARNHRCDQLPSESATPRIRDSARHALGPSHRPRGPEICPLCNRAGHGAIGCGDVSGPEPTYPNAVDAVPERAAARPKYSGSGRVLALPDGMDGDMLQAWLKENPEAQERRRVRIRQAAVLALVLASPRDRMGKWGNRVKQAPPEREKKTAPKPPKGTSEFVAQLVAVSPPTSGGVRAMARALSR